MPTHRDNRPNPDSLLQRVQREAAQAERGRLRIYFGSSAGVGKTFAMLATARKLQSEGREVLVGVVETHGRSETAALVEGLPLLPQKQIEYRGNMLSEFDLDAALAARPSLILVDELAHSNVPGSRHPKRWQDVEELLAAGIDVFTTLNVQHLESLNDVVGGITGIRVNETLPDTFFDSADEVVLVDVPADELLARLKAGKVYLGTKAEQAAQNFFRKGNLMALRELALRRTANRIEDEVQAYRSDQAIAGVWKTEAALLCGVGPDAGAEHVVRSAARLANQLNVAWHAAYVETPALQRRSEAARERILRTLKLAQELGATTTVLTAHNGAEGLIGYARSRNLSKLVIGRSGRVRQWPWVRRLHEQIASQATDIDILEIGRGAAGRAEALDAGATQDSTPGRTQMRDEAMRIRPYRYALSAAVCMLTTLLLTPLRHYLDQANIVMLFLMMVALVAVKIGRGPAVLAAFLCVGAFDFFFVSPRLSFAVADVQYLVTFVVMLAVGLIIGQMTASLRFQASAALSREGRSRALFEFAREMSTVLEVPTLIDMAQTAVAREFHAEAALLVIDAHSQLQLSNAAVDIGTAQWAFDRNLPAGLGTDTLPGSPFLYLPLKTSMRTRGVLAVKPVNPRFLMIPEQRRQLETFGALIAIALERVHYIEVAQEAVLRIESERLRNSLLSALSHDLRTPLSVLYGLAETLPLTAPPLSDAQRAVADAIQIEAKRMGALVNNLLDMARIQSGDIHLNLQWQPIEEVVGTSLAATKTSLASHNIETQMAAGLPLVRYDAVLIERVLCNLLENAAKYTPAGSTLRVIAAPDGSMLKVCVADNGPGLPAGQEEAIFEKFARGEKESDKPGVGLGLAICRAIVSAHGGRIRAAPASTTGATFCFTLPLGEPPQVPEEMDSSSENAQ
ncbi:MAG: kdpD [Rhodocyclales bacterium]|nr:kdpD [Rhodocyclales bacterium]